MATVQAMPNRVLDGLEDDFDDEDVIESGNWTEERKEILKNLTWEEIETDILRRQAECPSKALGRKELHTRLMEIQTERLATRRAGELGM